MIGLLDFHNGKILVFLSQNIGTLNSLSIRLNADNFKLLDILSQRNIGVRALDP